MAQLKNTTINGNLIVTGNVTTTSGADLNVIASGNCSRYAQNLGASAIKFKWEDNVIKMYVDNILMRQFVGIWNNNITDCNLNYQTIVVKGNGNNWITINEPGDGYRLINCYNGDRNATGYEVVSIDRNPNGKYLNIWFDKAINSSTYIRLELFWLKY